MSVVLEQERSALLDGDSNTVAKLALEKERIAASINAENSAGNTGGYSSPELADLARSVGDLARLNHSLLRQMYMHYHGMLELFMRIAGQQTTYGPDGMANISGGSLKDTKILA